MKNILVLLSAAVLMSFTTIHTVTVPVNTESSTINWIGSKISEQHNGIVKIKSGALILDHGRLAGGEFTIDMNTISTQDMSEKYNQKLDNHLKNEDFFNVDKFPTSTIKITQAFQKKGSNYAILAELTIKGETHPIAFDADVKINGNNYSAAAKIKIDRTKWGVTYNSGNFFEDLGDYLIKDEIEFDVFLLSVK